MGRQKAERRNRTDAKTIKDLQALMADECPPGYDAHKDPLSDDWSIREAYNRLAKGLRQALEILEREP